MPKRRLQPLAALLGGLLVLTSGGCVLETPLAVRRVWIDYNTLRAPAFYYDKITHEPPHAAQVKETRWMYNRGPHEIGPHSLIPPPQGMAPLPAGEPPLNAGPPPPLPEPPAAEGFDSEGFAPEHRPPSGPDAGTPDVETLPPPPLPAEPESRRTIRQPAATAPPRSARRSDRWRFIH